MKNMSLKVVFLLIVLSVGTVYSAEILLNDTWADGSRTETDLPTESAVWVSHPDSVTMGTGSLAFTQGTSSTKMWTYFRDNGNPVSLGIGEQLTITIEFTPKTALYQTTSRNFRFGIFNDPTNNQILSDTNSDSGGTGDPWMDSTGYGVQLALSAGPSGATASVGKRTGLTNASLLGSSGAWTWTNGGSTIIAALDTLYTLTLNLNRVAEDQMVVTFTMAAGETVITTHSITDNGIGSLPVYTDFDQLFFRMSSATGTADVIDYHSIKVEYDSEYQGPPIGTLYSFTPVQSCRTEGGVNAEANVADNNKLSVRNTSNGNKSWIKFNVSGYDKTMLKSAVLTVVFLEPKGGAVLCDVSAVNDDCEDNIEWTDADITWNNAPGNLTTDLGLLDPNKTTLVTSFSVTDPKAGDRINIDVLPFIQADTDGIVQFVLHNSDVLITFGTHDGAATYRPVLEVLEAPFGADEPNPYPGEIVKTSLPSLSWVNPDPNVAGTSIYCDVYLGTEPNRPQMDKVPLLGPDITSIAINTTNFTTFGNLADQTTYYWVVDCHDASSGPNTIDGIMWSFYTQNNEAPEVNAGLNQAVWLGMSGTAGQETVSLNGTTSDDGLPTATYSILWTQVSNGAPTVTIDPNNIDDTNVTFNERGQYVFMLTADDGEMQTSDTVTIFVGNNACDASHMSTGALYQAGDKNMDCIVNLADFAELICENWLKCSDTLTNCQ